MPVVAAPHLAHTQLVPGHLVHRRSLSDVLITEAHVIGGDTFLAGAHWPANHRLLGRGSTVDVGLAAETIRQLTIYLAHTEYDVPLGDAFLMGAMRVSVSPRRMTGVGQDLAVRTGVTGIRRTARGVVSFDVEAVLDDGLGEVARGSARARILDQRTYARARHGRTRPVTVNGSAPGRSGLDLLCPSGRPGVATLVVDTAERAFFDHPLDHVPGMLLIEAARQSVRDAGGPELTDVVATFDAVVELDEPCTVSVGRDGDAWSVRFDQAGATRTSVLARGRTRHRAPARIGPPDDDRGQLHDATGVTAGAGDVSVG